MVAPTNNNNIEAQLSEHETVLPKKSKRLEEQKVREDKKMAKRKLKADQKERKTLEKEAKEDERERKLLQQELAEEGLSGKEMEELKRIEEEHVLFEIDQFDQDTNIPTRGHIKKSALQSNRLGLVISH